MSVLRHFALVLGICAGMASLPDPGRATTLTYTSDSIIEFDLFHQWWGSGGFLWSLPSEPAPAAWARLHVEFDETLSDLGFYSINRWGSASPGQVAISDFSLSVETDSGRYAVNEYLYRDFEMVVETGVSGHVSDWEVSWEAGSSDYFRMGGSGGSDQVSWLFEYIRDPNETDQWGYPLVWDASGGGSFSGGRLSVAQSLGQGPLAPVPLPAPALLLLGGLAVLSGLRRTRALGA